MMRASTAVLALAALVGCGPPGAIGGVARNGIVAAGSLPQNLRGITFDNISSTCSASGGQRATEQLLDHPTIRVVFDSIGPACYATAIDELHAHGQTMGELVDSSAMKRYSLAQ